MLPTGHQLPTPRQSPELPSEEPIMALSPSDTSLHLPPRFAKIKQSLVARREEALVASWKRLLSQLKCEVDHITRAGPNIVPSIDFQSIRDDTGTLEFSNSLKKRGVGVIRRVVSKEVIEGWVDETEQYLSHNSAAEDDATKGWHHDEIYWSPSQVKARAHPDMLRAQAFLLNLWHASEPEAPVTTNFPVAYADHLDTGDDGDFFSTFASVRSAYMDGGSVERWEPDGYGLGSTYQKIWDGSWEEYDPWDSSTRLKIATNLYNSASTCGMLRMFNGWLCLGGRPPGAGPLRLCPMLQLSTAYVLLRPFFAPIKTSPDHPGFLSPENWTLETACSSAIQGAAPSFRQELNDTLHPHLRLSESMIPGPALEPGDYLIWHCDSIHAPEDSDTLDLAAHGTGMYLPACPLTEANAKYLSRQRRAFLLGQPGPDFDDGGRGEGGYMGRPGVQEVSDAGGEDGLRAMGLLPWGEDDVESGTEARVLEMANNILFPDRHDFDMAY